MMRNCFEANKRASIARRGGDVKAMSDPQVIAVDAAHEYYLKNPDEFRTTKDNAAEMLGEKFGISDKAIRSRITESRKK